MTISSAQATHIPRLGKLWLWTLVIALGSHLAIAAYIFATQPATLSGGGGKVIGTLSIALGGAPAAQPELTKTKETVTEDMEVPILDPMTKRDIAPPLTKPKPPKKRTQPRVQTRQAVTAPPRVEAQPLAKPLDQTTQPDTNTTDAPADAAPATIASNATPSLGEGAAAATPGIGGSVNAQTQSYDAYLALIRARIEAQRTYPASARRSGYEGTASVRVMIGAKGNLTSTQVTQSSGHFALDRAAKRMVQKAAPFPAPPDATFQVTVPIAFALR